MELRRAKSGQIGQALVWLSGGALALNLILAIGLIALIGYHGASYFWPKPIAELALKDGGRLAGEIHGWELVPEDRAQTPGEQRLRLKIGNRDLYGLDFRWVRESEIAEISYPADLVLFERLEWGNFYGRLIEAGRGLDDVPAGGGDNWARLSALLELKSAARERVEELESGEIGNVNHALETLRLEELRLRLEDESAATSSQLQRLEETRRTLDEEYQGLATRLFAMREDLAQGTALMRTADGREKEVVLGEIVRALRPNSMGFVASVGLYLSRVLEFVSGDPRESNTEGGIFPAIFGTVMMVFLMSFAVAPFGVIAALYLREYAREGPVVRAVRIAVNNLAGVPSIVFGVFGLGFFVYLVGGTIDQLFFPEALPTPTYGTGGILWASLTLALLTVPVVIVAAEEGLAAVPRIVREGSLALGATKFETTWRVVLPAAAPGILTGMILAMARAAGEVAPLMIVGMVKLAPTLPIDHHFPFVHLERKFMHLGFHVYDVGFQSPNVEAAQPLVFATALLLVGVVIVMNLVAIVVRNRLRKAYAGSAV